MNKEKRRVPKLRFPGFTEDWEQRKLEDICSYQSSSLTINDIDENGQYDLYDANSLIGKTNKGYMKMEYITIIKDGAGVGRTRMLPKNSMFLGTMGALTPKNKCLGFLYQLVTNANLGKICTGSTIPHIYFKDYGKLKFCIPSIIEQEVIGKFFNNIDYLITLHQCKLEHLNLKKKALLQKLFPKNGECYPELRFPGFTDAWEQCKLGEIFEYLQNNTLSRDALNYKNPNIKNIHYGDILVKFDEILDGSNKDIPYINSELDLSKFSKSLLRDGDIIFSDTAEDDTVGKAIELQNVNAPFILSGLHTIPCRPLVPFGKGYLGNFLNSDSYRLQLRPLVQGIKVSSISKSALKDTMIEYPKNLDEQEKIGRLFYHIAKMITLHQRKLEHLQLQKKALLQQMFV